MAEKHASGLSIYIGLTLSQLQSDFLSAEQTVRQGIAALNRQQNVVRLRMEADVAGLDSVADKTKIIEVREQALSQLLAMQRDRLTLATKAFQEYTSGKTVNATESKKLESAMERERLAVARLESELKNLSAQKVSIDVSGLQSNIEKISARIQNIRLKAEIDISQLQKANDAFNAQKTYIAAVTNELELQRQKLVELQRARELAEKVNGKDSVQVINIQSNILRQIQEINQLEAKLKELSGTGVNLQFRIDSLKNVESQIHENIARLNARIENIKVKAEIDVSRLGTAAGEFDKAKVHVAALTQELELQKQKLAELKTAISNATQIYGANHSRTLSLKVDFSKQIQEIDRLKAKIEELNNIPPPKTNNLLSNYLNIKGDVVGKLNQISSAFTGLSVASQSADGAITKALEIIGSIPSPVGKAVAALAAIPLVLKGIENSIVDMAKSTVAAGDAVYVMSRGMQLSIADMAKLSTIAKVTGIEINEVNSSLRRFSMQMTKSGDDSSLKAQALRRYGAEIYDVNGRLKNALELANELGKALRNAEAEGNGAAFRDIVGGKFWSADFVTFLEDFADNVEQAKKVIKNGLANPTWAHQIQGEINTLNAQTAQLGNVFNSALMPVTAEIVPKMQEQFGELTKIIAANKENVKFLGDAMALPIRVIHELTDGIISLSNAIDKAKDKENALGKMFANLGEYRDDVAALMNVAPTTALTAMFAPVPEATKLAVAAYSNEIDKFKKARAEAEQAAKNKDAERQALAENSLGLSGLNEAEQQRVDSLNQERIKREQETADIIYKLNHTGYENNLRDLENWKEEQLKIITETEEKIKEVTGKDVTLEDERGALDDNYAAKRIQIEQEKEQKLAEIRQRISEADKTELEKRMIAIEDEKDAWIVAGMEKTEAGQLAQQQLTQYISGVNQQLSAELNSLGQSDLQKKLAQIEQEKQAWIQKGADVAQAEQLAQEKIHQAHQETEDRLNAIREGVAALDRSEFENRLAQIEQEKNAWIQVGMEKAEAEELAQQKISKVVESEAEQRAQAEEQYDEQVAKAKEQYIKQVQAAQEEADRKNRQEHQDALNLLKSEAKEFEAYMKGGERGLQDYRYKQLIKQGVNPDHLRQMTPELMDAYRAAQEKADRSFLPNWRDRNSPKYVEPPEVKVPDILKDVPKSIDKVSSSSDKAAKSLDNLADAADKAAGNDNEREVPREVSRVEEPIRDYWTPPPGRGGAVGAYQQPDGSTLIQNMYPDVKHKDPLIGAAIPVGETGVDMGNLEKYAKDFPDIAAAIERGATDLNKSIEDITSPLNELPTNIQSTSENFSEMPTAVQSAAESLNELPTAVQGVMEQISAIESQQLPQDTELPSILSEGAQSLSQLPTVIQTASDSLNGLPVMVSGLKENLTSEVSQLFSPMSESLTTVTVKISDLGAALDSFLSQLNSASINQNQSQPIEVNNTISIDEAHAWDYDHIQELAEKVAEIIEPTLLRSIGGDSNSY